ncbi:MAG: hypothetical protein QN178_09825 [Armatimonadota bacterium]|nr:hypothetical protein [Armatimonadota bacterium]
MDAVTIEAQHRFVGGSRGHAPAPVTFEVPVREATLAELIEWTVRAQVRELRTRRALAPGEFRRVLDRLYQARESTSGDERAEGAGGTDQGRAASGGDLDVEAEVARALRGFAAGAYAVLVNGRQVERADDVIVLRATNRLTFLRLMAFSGG